MFTPKLFCFSLSVTVHQEIMPNRDHMDTIDMEVVVVDIRVRQRGGMITMDQEVADEEDITIDSRDMEEVANNEG